MDNLYYKKYYKVFELIDKIIYENHYAIIAIEGKCAAGKTTLSSFIASKYHCNIIHIDNFFLSNEQKTQERLQEIGGNIDYERFSKEVIIPLTEQKDFFHYTPYNCKKSKFENPILVNKKNVNIIEGVYSSHPYFNQNIDFIIFLDIDFDTQLKRILDRNGNEMLSRFKNEWIPLENIYFDYYKIKDKAFICI